MTLGPGWCCEAGAANFPLPCPWHSGDFDPRTSGVNDSRDRDAALFPPRIKEAPVPEVTDETVIPPQGVKVPSDLVAALRSDLRARIRISVAPGVFGVEYDAHDLDTEDNIALLEACAAIKHYLEARDTPPADTELVEGPQPPDLPEVQPPEGFLPPGSSQTLEPADAETVIKALESYVITSATVGNGTDDVVELRLEAPEAPNVLLHVHGGLWAAWVGSTPNPDA